MIDSTDSFQNKLRIAFAGVIVFASLLLLIFFVSSNLASNAQAKGQKASYDTSNPNVITSGLANAANVLENSISSGAVAINSGIRSFASATVRTSSDAAHSAKNGILPVSRAVGSGISFMGNTASSGMVSAVQAPGKVLGSISNTSIVSSVIRPHEHEHEEVPIIDPKSPELLAAVAAMRPAAAAGQPSPQGSEAPAWPISGQVTTEFGVSHRPYQRVHTGMDISSPNPAGVTPVKPFRPGRVVEVVYSKYSLGNHVVLDHGNGVTSVYAHLSSISVQKGQEVGLGTVLGLEGSTGMSTGPHLHFEIRVNGKAADPRQFISGNP